MSDVCDFCSEPHPEWYYGANKFALADVGFGSAGGWWACETCSQLIENGEDYELLHRSLERSPELAEVNALMGGLDKQERRYVEDQVMRLHRKFRRARSGPRRGFG